MDRDMLFQSEGPLRRALGLAERAMGTEHTLVAWVLDYLGWLASLRELNEEAVSYYRRALGIREARLGPDHRDTLFTIEALASALHTANAHEESERLALRAIAAYDAMGRDDVALAELIATVGRRQYSIGRIGEAEHLSLRALAMQERLLGSAHRDTADTALCVAMIYDYGGSKSAPANAPEIYYRKSLEGFAQACGDDDADTIRARFRLAEYLFRQGRSDEARPMFNCVVSDLTSGHSALDPSKDRWIIVGSCEFLRREGRESQARVIERWDSSFGSSGVMRSLARVKHSESAFGAQSLQHAESLSRLAWDYAMAGRVNAAAETAHHAMAIWSSQLGTNHPLFIEKSTTLSNMRDNGAAFWALRRSGGDFGSPHKGRFELTATSAPWRDERRVELIKGYLDTLGMSDKAHGSGAVEAVATLIFLADLEELWEFTLDVIGKAPDDDRILAQVAELLLEGFLNRFDAKAIDLVEEQATCDPQFLRVLKHIRSHEMSDAVWQRIQAIQG